MKGYSPQSKVLVKKPPVIFEKPNFRTPGEQPCVVQPKPKCENNDNDNNNQNFIS